MRLDETVTYLEMRDRSELIPAKNPSVGVEVKHVEIPCPELNRFFYTAIGGDWYWIDRLPWTYEQWMAYITRPGHETWVAYLRGTPVGYFELDGEPGGEIELAYFGILPQFTGQGIGGYLLTVAINRAWERNPTRVWLHTSSFDHPQALKHYLARGFRVVKRETCPKELPDQPPGPWPGVMRPRDVPGSGNAIG
jgi:ribosomal protein S18 acetylase RimI-like enzyme